MEEIRDQEAYSAIWAPINTQLRNENLDLSSQDRKYAQKYFDALVHAKLGHDDHAKKILDELDMDKKYMAFEIDQSAVLAALDLLVLGETKRRDPPAFRLDNN